jgi:hypothetical protein
MTGDVLGAYAWSTNAAMIADVARLGYLCGTVLDATYGEGKFWTEFRPPWMLTNDSRKSADFSDDYRDMRWADRSFDSVVFDPDYKLTGTPSSVEKDARYGTDEPKRWQDRMSDIELGAAECWRITRKYLLVKCMDQVVSGKMVWQTDRITRVVERYGGRKKDRFDFLNTPQPQPEGRKQVHARRCYSTLLVFTR